MTTAVCSDNVVPLDEPVGHKQVIAASRILSN